MNKIVVESVSGKILLMECYIARIKDLENRKLMYDKDFKRHIENCGIVGYVLESLYQQKLRNQNKDEKVTLILSRDHMLEYEQDDCDLNKAIDILINNGIKVDSLYKSRSMSAFSVITEKPIAYYIEYDYAAINEKIDLADYKHILKEIE